ncbi:MAG: hypothetical protein ABIH24_03615 [Verrucomicrobiota bacterium]
MKAKFPVSSFQCRRSKNACSGLTLIGIIAAIVVMGLLGAGMLMLVSTGSMESIQSLNWGQAFFAAESGVSAARAYMSTNATWRTNSNLTTITGAVGQASFVAVLDTNGVIKSVGSKDEAQWTSMWHWRPFDGQFGGQHGWAILVYGTRTAPGTPKYRFWGGTNWSSPSDAVNVGTRNINWVVVKACPKRDEYIAATIDDRRVVKAQVYRGESWGNLQTIATNANAANRGVDIAYETLSGDAMVVASDSDADPTYYVWNGSAWTGPGTINISRTGIARWIKLASDPVSDEIVVMVQDANRNYTAQVWNGSNAWGNELLCTGRSVNVAYEAMDVEYETSGGQGIIVNNSGIKNRGRFNWCAWNGTNWSAQSTNNALGDYFRFGTLANDPHSDKLLFTYVDNDSDIGKVFWNGSAWGPFTELETSANSAVDRPVQGQFETISGHAGHALVVYSDTARGRSRHSVNPSDSSWDAEISVSTIQDSSTVQARRTGDGKILALFFDDQSKPKRYDFSWHDGTNWSAKETLETNPSVTASPYKEPFMMAPQLWVLP